MAEMDARALQAEIHTLTARLDELERRAERVEAQWLLERTRNEVWQLKEDNRRLQAEIDLMREARAR